MKHTKHQLKRLLFFARLVHKQYDNSSSHQRFAFLNGDSIKRLTEIERRIERAEELGFALALQRLNRNYRRTLERIHSEASTILNESENRSPIIASLADIFRDLIALNDEFTDVAFRTDRQTLSVVTEPIVLRDVCLGAFKIRLDVASLTRDSKGRYEVIALDPNPASSNEDVTHPHVESARLCEGAAARAIGLALQQGRLLDFFHLVANVLRTYNPSSAYCPLETWTDVFCSDCGDLGSADDVGSCARCDSRICTSCECRCQQCDDYFCGECSQVCSGCRDNVCNSCVKHCNQCDQYLCADCFPNEERCVSCDEQDEKNEEDVR